MDFIDNTTRLKLGPDKLSKKQRKAGDVSEKIPYKISPKLTIYLDPSCSKEEIQQKLNQFKTKKT